eukprot:SAG31_NODE_1490_length_8134_cov_3.892968_1_plen_147_part_00
MSSRAWLTIYFRVARSGHTIIDLEPLEPLEPNATQRHGTTGGGRGRHGGGRGGAQTGPSAHAPSAQQASSTALRWARKTRMLHWASAPPQSKAAANTTAVPSARSIARWLTCLARRRRWSQFVLEAAAGGGRDEDPGFYWRVTDWR